VHALSEKRKVENEKLLIKKHAKYLIFSFLFSTFLLVFRMEILIFTIE